MWKVKNLNMKNLKTISKKKTQNKKLKTKNKKLKNENEKQNIENKKEKQK